MTRKNILIIGGGFGQLPAIEISKSIGLYVHVVDANLKAIGMNLADEAHHIDVLDCNKIVELARELDIDGVLTIQSDIGVPSVGEIVDALKLPGNGAEVAKKCSNKIFTRLCFEDCGIPQPIFFIVENINDATLAINKLGLPCIIKAPDSSGSRGVIKINNLNDLEKAFHEAMLHTKSKQLLVEEFIAGNEIGAQAFSINGKCVLALVHDDEISPPPYMIPIGHAFPSSLNKNDLNLYIGAIKKAVDALGIDTGPSNIDLIIDKNGQVKIIEIGARMGATCLPELVYYHTGINWVLQSIKAALGEPVDLEVKKDNFCAAFIIEANRNGIFYGFNLPSSMQNHSDILEWEVTAKPGDKVSILRKGTDRIGKVVTRGKTQKDAIDLAHKFKKLIKFDIRDN